MNDIEKYYIALGLDKDSTLEQLTEKYQSMKAQFDEQVISEDSDVSKKARENLIKLHKLYAMVSNDIKSKTKEESPSTKETSIDSTSPVQEPEGHEQASTQTQVITAQTESVKVDTDEQGYKERVATHFDKQAAMKTFGAVLAEVQPGKVTIELPFASELTDQNGYIHPGVVASIADCACSSAACSLLSNNSNPMIIEHKVSFISNAKGDVLKAVGSVLKSGVNVTYCSGDVFAITEAEEKEIAVIQATIINSSP